MTITCVFGSFTGCQGLYNQIDDLERQLEEKNCKRKYFNTFNL